MNSKTSTCSDEYIKYERYENVDELKHEHIWLCLKLEYFSTEGTPRFESGPYHIVQCTTLQFLDMQTKIIENEFNILDFQLLVALQVSVYSGL